MLHAALDQLDLPPSSSMSAAAPPTVTNSGEDVILASLEVVSERIADAAVSLAEAYEIEMTLSEIARGGYERVCLAALVSLGFC